MSAQIDIISAELHGKLMAELAEKLGMEIARLRIQLWETRRHHAEAEIRFHGVDFKARLRAMQKGDKS